MEITLLIVENHGIVFWIFVGTLTVHIFTLDKHLLVKPYTYCFTAAQFRSMLVEFEREHTRLLERNEELETNIKQIRQLESRNRSSEQRVSELQRRLSETERLRRDLEGKVGFMFKYFSVQQVM